MTSLLKLMGAWPDHFSVPPTMGIRTPGRVNLIGEHVDHQAYPVCPCTIEQAITAILRVEKRAKGEPFIKVVNLDPTYPTYICESPKDLKIQDNKPWHNYIVAATFGMIEHFATKPLKINPKIGLSEEDESLPLEYSISMLIDANLPPASGLSSSAALVVTTILAWASIDPKLSHKLLADIAAQAERYVGVASGGMDQASILLSERNSALLIHFKPLDSKPIQLPKGAALVIANSCRLSPKAQLADKMYNKRVFELKAGCLALIDEKARSSISVEDILKLQLRDVVQDYLHLKGPDAETKALEIVEQKVRKGKWSKAEMIGILGEERKQAILDKLCGQGVWDNNDDFEVYERLKHVLSEAARVETFASVVSSSTLSEEEKLVKLGQLMNQSHESMTHDFDAGCTEVNDLVKIARTLGAYGARITGAGWGGCMVALIPEKIKDTFLEGMKNQYYLPLMRNTKKYETPMDCLPEHESDISKCLFVTVPSSCAERIYFFK